MNQLGLINNASVVRYINYYKNFDNNNNKNNNNNNNV